MKQIKLETVFDQEQYDGDWPPTDAAGALAWFSSKVNEVPEEFRESANIEIDSTTSYDMAYARIKITYTRPETDAEEADRKREEAALAEFRRNDELRTLAALQAKYATHPKD